ncbi:unnamed protein product, partial [Mesorhabditis belari]|uniref:Peptidase S1 domain-containing protein n=1 Tax=Mesorhabditis belari TaxID=2138241 RepID=A0AAF3EUS8_9BILA
MLFLIFLLFLIDSEAKIALPTQTLPPSCGLSSVGMANQSQSAGSLNEKFYILPENRVVGGVQTEAHEWPWVVQLFYNGSARCGGAIIDNHLILTAAHCFARGPDLSLYRIVSGVHRYGDGAKHLIVKIRPHPLHNILWTSAYDAAIAEIWPPLNYSRTTQPICLPVLPVTPFKICVVAGWGLTSENGALSEYLREIHVPILPLSICNNHLHYGGWVHAPSMLCAGYTQGQVDSCYGDSGGPLMCLNKGKWEVQGLVSWGVGCGRPGHPGIYTKVSAVTPWIRVTSTQLKWEREHQKSLKP